MKSVSASLRDDLVALLGHPPPYTQVELLSLRQLTSRGGRHPYGFKPFSNLRSVGFNGCGAVDLLRDIGHRPQVHSLHSWSSGLADIDGIAELLPGVSRFDVNNSWLTDITPLLELKHLEFVKLAGCPLDEHSYREVYPYLVKNELVREHQDHSRIRQQEWELMNAFKRRGLKLSAFSVGDDTRITAPGHTVWDNPYGRAFTFPLDDAYKVLDDHPDADEAAYIDACKSIIKERRGW